MHLARSARLPVRNLSKTGSARVPRQCRKMSFLPHTFVTDSSPSTFHPLFRLLDDFDQYSRGNQGPHGGLQVAANAASRSRGGTHVKIFTPKFDVQETNDAYELHGDLPGIEQKDVEIDFTDHQTLSIRGRHERSYSSGTPPVTPAQQGEKATPTASPSLKATVEDEDEQGQQAKPQSDTQVAKVDQASSDVKKQEPQRKVWVSERSIGEFSRSFTFPVRVDQDNVKASMKNGVLSITVPKAKRVESRRIHIS